MTTIPLLVKDEGWVGVVAEKMGASAPALRLLISLLMAYPMVFFHRAFLHGKLPVIQHIFFILGGSYIGYFNYGISLLHAYLCIGVQYIALMFTKGTLFSVVFAFTFQMLYLLTEYFLTETETYDIKWTIPHCVLTLRLIGQAFDVYDGTKKDEDLSGEQRTQALRRFPTFLETAAHCFFPGSFLIGPQFPMKRYLDFVEGKFGKDGKPPASVMPGLQRLGLGMFYVALYQVFSPYFTNDYLLSPAFAELNLWKKMLFVGFYGKMMLYKYVSCWIVIEGSCIVSGISYNGKDKNGELLWDGCENIGIGLFEKSYKFGHVIASFNKCTNKWIAQNIYKRLKFMGSREISQFGALLFLAVWHGLHSGYYMCFFMEFIVMNSERKFESLVTKIPALTRWHNSTIGFWVDVVISKFFVFIYFGYCMIPFGLLKWRLWTQAYGSLYYNGTLLFGLFPFAVPFLKSVLVPRPPKDKESSSTVSSSAFIKDKDNHNSNESNSNMKSSPVKSAVHNGKQD